MGLPQSDFELINELVSLINKSGKESTPLGTATVEGDLSNAPHFALSQEDIMAAALKRAGVSGGKLS